MSQLRSLATLALTAALVSITSCSSDTSAPESTNGTREHDSSAESVPAKNTGNSAANAAKCSLGPGSVNGTATGLEIQEGSVEINDQGYVATFQAGTSNPVWVYDRVAPSEARNSGSLEHREHVSYQSIRGDNNGFLLDWTVEDPAELDRTRAVVSHAAFINNDGSVRWQIEIGGQIEGKSRSLYRAAGDVDAFVLGTGSSETWVTEKTIDAKTGAVTAAKELPAFGGEPYDDTLEASARETLGEDASYSMINTGAWTIYYVYNDSDAPHYFHWKATKNDGSATHTPTDVNGYEIAACGSYLYLDRGENVVAIDLEQDSPKVIAEFAKPVADGHFERENFGPGPLAWYTNEMVTFMY